MNPAFHPETGTNSKSGAPSAAFAVDVRICLTFEDTFTPSPECGSAGDHFSSRLVSPIAPRASLASR